MSIPCDLCGTKVNNVTRSRSPGWDKYVLHTPDTKCYYLCSSECLREFAEGLDEMNDTKDTAQVPRKARRKRRTKQ